MSSILIVDDYPSERLIMAKPLLEEGYDVVEARDGEEALNKMKDKEFDLVITDLKIPGMDGIELLKRTKGLFPRIVVIIVTAYGTIDEAVCAMKEGAYDFIRKPIDPDELLIKVKRALEQLHLVREREYLKEEIRGYMGEMVGRSPGIKEVFEAIRTVSKTDAPVLIMGENGVGKELVARAIHEASGRKGPFVPVALSAIPQDLVESELFGHEKGAFTGAISRRIGRFELASHGTIFLDEVGEIPPSLQVKLLRVLQEGEYQRLGSSPTLKTHARVIAATNQDLPSKIKKGEFREDLYYRLNVFPIYIPPLRERKEDIPLLVEHFIKKYNPRLGREVVDVSQEAMDILMEYEWPGNIRELENIVQRAMIISEKRVIGKEAILTKHPKHPIEKRGFEGAVEDLISSYEPSCKRTLWDLTLSTLVRQAISRTQNKEEAAKLLGISRPTLYHWLRKGLT